MPSACLVATCGTRKSGSSLSLGPLTVECLGSRMELRPRRGGGRRSEDRGTADAPVRRRRSPADGAGRSARAVDIADVVGQTLLGGSVLVGLTDAVSLCVMPAFIFSSVAGSRRWAPVLRVVTTLSQVAGHYGIAALRDFGVSPFYVSGSAVAAVGRASSVSPQGDGDSVAHRDAAAPAGYTAAQPGSLTVRASRQGWLPRARGRV